ncbi:hypothetical protein KIPB_006649 [Kipferlia bialata]|uniref:Protein kinase domain-containing protein n=1 Tax=Kipferlia bialata TaxID=797122 RepID=A0A9K3D0J4_9EUKA|nr:hypothetical protein KIPB_006649 [Kipferlia bialata]|eukprot:g6649.t1
MPIEYDDKLGEGDFGRVYKVTPRDHSVYPLPHYAVKTQDMDMIASRLDASMMKRNIKRELAAGFRVVDSPNVVKCHDHFINTDQSGTEMVIVMDLLPGKNFSKVLFEDFPDRCAHQPIPHMLSIMEQVFSLSHTHTHTLSL